MEKYAFNLFFPIQSSSNDHSQKNAVRVVTLLTACFNITKAIY